MVSKTNGKLFLKVERGLKPLVRVYDDSRRAEVSIPTDQIKKWPSLHANMSGGITITLQKLEQQYKITVQHILERKPDVCVYVNASGADGDIRTSVREMNTQLEHVGVAGPNLEVTGRIKASKVTFESTVGALHTNAKLYSHFVGLNAQHIFIQSEALFSCSQIRMVSRRVRIDGRLCPHEGNLQQMTVNVDSALLHIGVDGVIGATKVTKEKCASKSSEVFVDTLIFRLSGCLANFGRIFSQSQMEIRIGENLLSLKDGRIDSAPRGYTALKRIKGITSEGAESLPTSSTLSSAIVGQNPNTVAQLLEIGVDPNDSGESALSTPRKIATVRYKEMKKTERRNKLREKLTLIQALMSTYSWRRGLISSDTIVAKIGQNCSDCAQFRASNLLISARGSANCERDSIWTSGTVTLTVQNGFFIEGQIKHQSIDVHCGGNIITTNEGIVSQEHSGKIVCTSFDCAGIWSVGEDLSLECENATFLQDSFLEVDFMDCKIEKSCIHGGTWQIRSLNYSLGENLLMLDKGKVLVDEGADLNAMSFICAGVWKTNGFSCIYLRGSLSVSPTGRINASILKMSADGYCTIAGHIQVENLLAYVKNDLITSSTARVGISNDGTVAAGIFKNDAAWISECNLHLHVATFKQRDEGIIMAKDTLSFSVFDESTEKCYGRIVANYCIIRASKKLRFDGYIRVNQIEIDLPHANESRCTIGGQLEVLNGALFLKGRSDFSDFLSDMPHPYPALVLEGQVKADAIVAPFLALRLSSSSYALLSGVDSISAASYRTLISSGALHTMRASLIDSVSSDTISEAILCATTWVHEGHIRFRGDSVFLIADNLINWGRLTNEGAHQNHMKKVSVFIGNSFKNEAVFSADRIFMSGNGQLNNKHRIFATQFMDIDLSNFRKRSENGNLEAAKLLSTNADWNVSGRSDLKRNLDSHPLKIFSALKKTSFKPFRMNARSQLLINSDVITDQGSLVMIAQETIIIDSEVDINSLELVLGPTYEAEIIIKSARSLCSKQIRVNGDCKFLKLKIDGRFSCESIIFEESIKNIKVIGNGSLICKRSFNIIGESVSFAIKEMQMTEILCSSINLNPKTDLLLMAVDDCKTLTVYADNFHSEGNILLATQVALKLGKGKAYISGEILGIVVEAEFSVECDELIVDGIISSLDFLEIYARKRIEFCKTSAIKALRNAAVEAEIINSNGALIDCGMLTATADEVLIEGELSGSESTYALFARNVQFGGNADKVMKLELSGENVDLAGVMSEIKALEVDGNVVHCSTKVSDSEEFSVGAVSLILDGPISVESFSTNSLEIVLIKQPISANFCNICTAFLVLISEDNILPSSSQIRSVVCTTESCLDFDTKNIGLLISINNGIDVKTSQRKIESLSQILDFVEHFLKQPTMELNGLKESFMEQELFATSISLPFESDYSLLIHQIARSIQYKSNRLLNVYKFIALIRQSCSHIISDSDDLDLEESGRFLNGLFSDIMNQLSQRLKRSDMRSSRHSTEDCGYASRSSSEDIGEKKDLRKFYSPIPPLNASFPVRSPDAIDENVENEIANKENKPVSTKENESLSVSSKMSCFGGFDADGKSRFCFVNNHNRAIAIGFVNFHCLDAAILRPQPNYSKPSSSIKDLTLKKLKIKETVSSFELQSFGSESSLASIENADGKFFSKVIPSPMKRSQIPRFSSRRMMGSNR